MNDTQQRTAAKKFAAFWAGEGSAKAHQNNDRAVMQAYGFSIRDTSLAFAWLQWSLRWTIFVRTLFFGF